MMSSNRVCPNCGAINRPGDARCSVCIKPFSGEEKKQRLQTPKKHFVTRRRVLIGLGELTLAGGWWSGEQLRLQWLNTLHASFVYRGHTGFVAAVAWSPDSKHLASSDGNGTVQLWEATTGKTLLTYQSHAQWVGSMAWSPDGKRIASSSDNFVQVWDAPTGNHVLTYEKHTANITLLSWAPDSRSIASGSYDGTVQIWDAATGKHLSTFEHISWNPARTDVGWVQDVAWSPDGKQLASFAEYDARFFVWDANTGSTVWAPQGDLPGETVQLAWAPDGKHIVTISDADMGASNPGVITGQVWDTTTGQTVLTSPTADSCGLQAVAWRPDGKRILFTDSCNVWMWESTRGKLNWTSLPLSPNDLNTDTMAFSPDGKHLAAGDHETVQIWDLP